METIKKSLILLKMIAEKPLNVTEAAEQLKIHKSSASRMLSVMQKEGFVALNSERKYEIGQAIYTLSTSSTEVSRLRSLAHPFLEALRAQLDETIHLAVLSDNSATYIDKIDSSRLIRMYSKIGNSGPLHCTGVGKALLAFQKTSDIDKIISKINFEKFTESTLMNAEDLKETLLAARKEGVAYDLCEHDNQLNCIAAPVFDFRGKVVASISITSPVFYTDIQTLKGYKKKLLDTALAISQKLGYNGEIPQKN